MLVLHRKERESLSIGDDIQIVVTRIQKGQVRLGITAPKSILILRDELPVIQKPPGIYPPLGVFKDGWLVKGDVSNSLYFSKEVPPWENGSWAFHWSAPRTVIIVDHVITWRFPDHLTPRECIVAVGPKVEGS